jgi:hypothetical protein
MVRLEYGGNMTTSLTERREFLKQAGLVGSLGSAAMMAGLSESAMAFGGALSKTRSYPRRLKRRRNTTLSLPFAA